MFDLSHDICEAKQNLEGWKWLNGQEEYPHIIAENMMRRVYAMSIIWKKFEQKNLPQFSAMMAFHEMESIYCSTIQIEVDPFINTWLDSQRSAVVGGISFAYWDGLATSAGSDESILEEIEFSYIFHFLVDKCVLYWIALCQSGTDPKTAMGKMTGRVIEDENNYTYDMMKWFFQETYVKQYVHDHIPNGAQPHSYLFMGDKFSQPTSNLSAYICSTPGLCDFIKAHPNLSDFSSLLRAFELNLHEQGLFTPLLRARVDNIRKGYAPIATNLEKLYTINQHEAQDDRFDLLEYKRRLDEHEEIVNYFSVCDHPYVCSQIADELLKTEALRAEGFVYLQKALNVAFSFPNPFWHNKDAIQGCVDSLSILSKLLSENDKDDFKKQFGFSLFKIQYLLLRRGVCLSANSSDQHKLFSDLALLIEKNREEIIDAGMTYATIDAYLSYLRQTNDSTDGEKYLAEILFRQFDSDEYDLYWKGNLHIEEHNVADLVRYLQDRLQIGTSMSMFFNGTRFRTTYTASNEQSPKSWTKTFTEEEYRKIDIATLKDASSNYKKFFEEHNIEYLYHFTDRRNLESIKEHGGLFSCRYLTTNNISTHPGGDEELQRIDREYDLDDYVRLSFVHRHPMGWRLKMNENRDFVVLKIRKDVAFSKDTLFSDVNAATPEHQHGGGIENLKAVNLDIVNIDYAAMNSKIQEQRTAEVMVRKSIPLEYIINIDNPESF